MKAREIFIVVSVSVLSLVFLVSIFWPPILWSLLVLLPLLLLGISDILQKKHTIKNNFPLVGRFRYILEDFRPEIMQYFVETDTEGTPINRLNRSLIYQRAKNETDTTPFGTRLNVYAEGYECIAHSMYPVKPSDVENDPRVLVGGPQCSQPYSASILNVSAMSFGSLSENAILALNKGAALGGFAHNTGEGGISPYHLKNGGDLIWQIGTGYFGCRTLSGDFDADRFRENALRPEVKMIELKLSQGAKPGHGGILPAKKNTPEIAEIRGVKPYTDVLSPTYHTAFSDAQGLVHFIGKLRLLSNGKPVGFKLCIGEREEFEEVCRAMKETGIWPDFITVDGGEGGTGAAPVEFSNSIGLPLVDGLTFVHDSLIKWGLRGNIRVMASGKIFDGFHIAKTLALGADLCNSARAMMMALGCIQALECHTNSCPVGVATQNKSLMKGLDVGDKSQRVASYHKNTLHSLVELMAAAGIKETAGLKRKHILRRTGPAAMIPYSDLYPEAAG